jgi:thiosulfate dehydrogenase
LAGVIVTGILFISFISTKNNLPKKHRLISSSVREIFLWQPPEIDQVPLTGQGALIHYGKNLVANTSVYLGPKGTVARITNGMNCQNCHLEAGTKNWGNNYSAVYSTYPKFRERSGSVENIYKRVNDCIERSLNGKHALDTNSQEMQAIAAYINWLGHEVPKNLKPSGSGIKDLPFPDRAADPAKGKIIYSRNCQRCHGINGEGLLNSDSSGYAYPPLWGKNSYTTAAGLFRISRFAGYVRYNMPFDKTSHAPQLTDEEAWDVAAFVNTQSRPRKIYKNDWPNISGKPVDHPFAPYADSFSETQHKYGPFTPIMKSKMKAVQGRSSK